MNFIIFNRKTLSLLSLAAFAIALCNPDTLFAQDNTLAESSGSDISGREPEGDSQNWEMMILDRFLNLPPERLAEIRRTIESIEKMSPEERDALRRRVRDYKKLRPNMKRYLKSSLRNFSPGERRLLSHHFFLMTQKQRSNEQERISRMTPEERQRYYLEAIEKMRRQYLQMRRRNSIQTKPHKPQADREHRNNSHPVSDNRS